MGWLTVGKQFIKPFTKTGAESVASWKSKAAKAKLKMAKENLEQTFKKTDKELKKLKQTTDRITWYQKAANKRRYSKHYYKD